MSCPIHVRCSSLTEIVLPASITEIHTFALYDCNALVSITVPAGVTVVGEVSLVPLFFPLFPSFSLFFS